MEHIEVMAEVISNNRKLMPDCLFKTLMYQSKMAMDAFPNLYKLTWTMVDSHAYIVEVEDGPHVELSHKNQTLIVEAVDGGNMLAIDMPHHGMIPKSWIKRSKPLVVMHPVHLHYMVIIHSIEPYYKRARSE